jgi:lantibiotic modifying enzyme
MNPQYLNVADRIGARLCRDAFWDGVRCNWVGDAKEVVFNSLVTVHRSLGPDLYGGTSGIALFLARLYSFSSERLFRRTAQGALEQALSRLEVISPESRFGFYSGWAGIADVCMEVGELFETAKLAKKGLKLLRDQLQKEPETSALDLVSGVAGSIAALLRAHRRYPSSSLVEMAMDLGQHLLSNANRTDQGWSWRTLPEQMVRQDLTGLSHGAAGIGWVLLELYCETGEKAFEQAALEAFRYERHCFSTLYQNWSDFRRDSAAQSQARSPNYGLAWCHGAPGIGLTRLRAYELVRDDTCRQEVESAIRSTARAIQFPTGGESFCLCHGLSGNAELLLSASDVFGIPEYRSVAEQIGSMGMMAYENARLPWPCGVPDGGETPNLMLGLSGIGYFYLRLHDSTHVPSILLPTPRAKVT